MRDKFDELGEAYIGLNKAHLRFKQKITNEKVFVYIFMKNRKQLFSFLQQKIEDTRKTYGNKFSLGIITKGDSQTSLKAIIIRANENDLIAKNFEEFESQIYSKVFSEIHRIFVDYTIDLYNEIIQSHQELPKYNNLSYKHSRETAYNDIGLSIMPVHDIGGSTVEKLKVRMNLLESTRHVIEHNDGIVDEKFLQKNPNSSLNLGEKIDIRTEQIGEVIAMVEVLAEDLNKRALDKFDVG